MSDRASLTPAAKSPSSITLILGGVRAGKSSRALEIADSIGNELLVCDREVIPRRIFAATAEPIDDEMSLRIAAHQQERSADWETIEEPLRLRDRLDSVLKQKREIEREPMIVVIDCLTLWTGNLLLKHDGRTEVESIIKADAEELILLMQSSQNCHWVIVSNEVGLGVVPASQLGRLYRDVLGRVNRMMAAAASRVELLVAGVILPIKTVAREADQSPAG